MSSARALTCLSLTLAGCATWQAPAEVSDAALRSRAVTEARHDVRVSAAVLDAADTRRMLGADLDTTDVQPVWIEVRNGTSQPLWLLRSGTDPDYYSPLEVAWSLHTPFGGSTNARIDDHFDKLALKNPIGPGTTRAGILFTNPDRRTKLLNVDLLGRRTLIPFSLFLPVPDEAADRGSTLFRYPDAQVVDYTDLAAFRAALERLPCCATDAHGATPGDPLNVVFVGQLADIGAAVVRRNYRRDARADDMAQQVFGRPPDAVLRKQAQASAQSTSMRVWLAPIRFDGRPVYIVQAGRPVGGRFGPRGATDIVLHDDVDEARNLLDPGHDVFGRSGEARVRDRCRRGLSRRSLETPSTARGTTQTACARSCSSRRGRSPSRTWSFSTGYRTWRDARPARARRKAMHTGRPVAEPHVAVASLAIAMCVALGACAAPPLMPYSADTPPLVLAPASQVGVQDQRARFREIYCAVLEARGRALPDYRPCEEALTRVGTEPAGTGKPVDLGPSKRRLVAAVVPGIGYECFERWLDPPGTVVRARTPVRVRRGSS